MNQLPIFIIGEPYGRFGNIIIKYAALSCLLKNYKYTMEPIVVNDIVLPLKYNNKIDYTELSTLNYPIIEENNIQEFNKNIFNYNCIVKINGYYQRYSYFNNEEIRNSIRNAFIDISSSLNITSRNELVIHIRSGDQWLYNKPNRDAVHRYQHIVPIRFYIKLLKDNNLPVRFVCETLDDKFIKQLKLVFPNAIFQSSSILDDFITLLSAKRLVLSVSTFSWCAGWLNNVADEIIIPNIGFLNENFVNTYEDEIQKVDFKINESRYKYVDIESFDIYKRWLGDDNDYENIIN